MFGKHRKELRVPPAPPTPEPAPAPQNISISGITGSAVTVGSDNHVVHSSTVSTPPANTEVVDQAISALRGLVEAQAGAALQAPGLEHVAAIDAAVKADPPDGKALIRARDWFTANLPAIAPAVAEVLAHPTIETAVEAAAQIARGTAHDKG